MSDIRTTIVLKDPKEVGFIQEIRRDYPAVSEAAIIRLMLRIGFDNLQRMSRNELMEALLKG